MEGMEGINGDCGKLSRQVLDSFCGDALMICLISLLKVIW
jgi:hypothetical protein